MNKYGACFSAACGNIHFGMESRTAQEIAHIFSKTCSRTSVVESETGFSSSLQKFWELHVVRSCGACDAEPRLRTQQMQCIALAPNAGIGGSNRWKLFIWPIPAGFLHGWLAPFLAWPCYSAYTWVIALRGRLPLQEQWMEKRVLLVMDELLPR